MKIEVSGDIVKHYLENVDFINGHSYDYPGDFTHLLLRISV